MGTLHLLSILKIISHYQSLGCLLYAIAYGESPFERKYYESGASVALASSSGRYGIPNDNPYSKEVTQMISWLLKPNPSKRPFLDQVLDKLNSLIGESDEKSIAVDIVQEFNEESVKFSVDFEQKSPTESSNLI